MEIDCGIIGLPNVGKSTLFNILTNELVRVDNFPFCTIQPNVSVVHVPDFRLYQLKDIAQSSKTVHSTIRFVDVAGLIKGAARGVGMGSQILNRIRSTKVLCHMVRCFDNDQIIHVFNGVDPCRDISSVNTELVLFDILQCEKSICNLKKKYNIADRKIEEQLFVLKKCLNHLYDGTFLRNIQFSKVEEINIRKFNFLTIKPVIYIANIDEKSVLDNVYLNKLRIFTSNERSPLIIFSALLRSSKIGHNNIGVNLKQKERVLHDVANAVLFVLNLCTFFTVNLNIARAWIYAIGTTALEAADIVHSDFKKGFIRVQVINYHNFVMYKGELGAKRSGKIRYEGRDYCIQDGDILKFLFRN